VTRFADRFVALVPAAGFARRQGIVHDTSNSGQSLFVEPLEACESNNRLLELRADALAEERRILRELAAEVRAAAPALAALEDTLAVLDALRACASWAVEFARPRAHARWGSARAAAGAPSHPRHERATRRRGAAGPRTRHGRSAAARSQGQHGWQDGAA
jgi:DNA mismatch repair protein MutS2